MLTRKEGKRNRERVTPVRRCVAVRERASERKASERASGERASERRASERASGETGNKPQQQFHKSRKPGCGSLFSFKKIKTTQVAWFNSHKKGKEPHPDFALIYATTGPIYSFYSLVFPHPKAGTFTQIFICSTKCSSAKVVIFTWICTFMRHFLPVKVKMAIFMLLASLRLAARRPPRRIVDGGAKEGALILLLFEAN